MYTKFFELDELPFDGLPDKRFYFVGLAQHQALDLLTQNLSRNGSICILSGASGSGKTTLVRMLIRSLPSRMRIIAIDDPRLDEHMLLATILRASGVVATSFESIAELTLKLRRLLEHSMDSGILTTVIVDEAQGLSDEVIEQIRLISNIEGDLGKMINFLLVGQEDLIAHIQQPEHKMFWGRVKAFANIPNLKRDEVQAYVTFRLQQAGCHEPVFSQKAITALFNATKGLPRLINSIADRTLEIAAKAGRHHVSSHMVKKAEQIVRHRRGFFVNGYRAAFSRLVHLILVKIPLVFLGIACAAAAFGAAYMLLPKTIDSQTVEAMVSKERLIHDSYTALVNQMLTGRKEETRERALFDISVANSIFKTEAVDTLIKVWGYARKDGSKISCKDLEGSGISCMTEQGSFSELSKYNRPVVVTLRDDNLTPFYGVLLHLNEQKGELLLGDKLWIVNRNYLEHVYDGEYTLVQKELPRGNLEKTDDAIVAELSAVMKKFFADDDKISSIKNRKELEQTAQYFRTHFSSEDEAARVYDLLSTGPRLEFQ